MACLHQQWGGVLVRADLCAGHVPRQWQRLQERRERAEGASLPSRRPVVYLSCSQIRLHNHCTDQSLAISSCITFTLVAHPIRIRIVATARWERTDNAWRGTGRLLCRFAAPVDSCPIRPSPPVVRTAPFNTTLPHRNTSCVVYRVFQGRLRNEAVTVCLRLFTGFLVDPTDPIPAPGQPCALYFIHIICMIDRIGRGVCTYGTHVHLMRCVTA